MQVPPPRRGPDGQGSKPGPQEPEPSKKSVKLPLGYIMAGLALLLLIRWAAEGTGYQRIETGQFWQMVADGKVRSVVLTSSKVRGELHETGPDGEPKRFETTRPQNDEKLLELLQEKLAGNWDYRVSMLESPLLYWLLPLVFIVVLWRMILTRMNPVSSVMDFSQSRANIVAQKDVGITFDDVAGIEECKQELAEVVEFLQNPSKFTRLGGRIPKGVLLVGPPGTGKTLLAKAVAGEAGVTFFSLSGSDFVEMFVGVGAARVRDLFDQAQKAAPCIIFIDELDALGKARGMGMMGGHDEREQTLNALLVQMDGFQTQKAVILLAATNRPEMLDPALLRPGRFDRHVVVSPPDLRDREKILEVHAKNIKVADAVDLRKLAAMTPGFVGADLANLVNEATLLAARHNKNQVEMVDFENSIERVVAGLEKRSRLMNDDEKKIVAHHEAGHALAACLLPGADPVRKVSMIPRGAAALGYTMQMPIEDRYVLRKSELMDRLVVLLGGRSAEEVVFGEVSTGAQNDLQKASELAREMVTEFGMSEELGPLSYSGRSSRSTMSEFQLGKSWSEQTTRKIDEAVRSLVDTAHGMAVRLLEEHEDTLCAIAAALQKKEVLEEEELGRILQEHNIHLPQRPRYEEADDGRPVAAGPEPSHTATGEADPAEPTLGEDG